MVIFDAEGPVEVAVTRTAGVMRLGSRPPPLLRDHTGDGPDGKTATFTLSSPLDVSFEADGDILRNVHVFAGAVAEGVPLPDRG